MSATLKCTKKVKDKLIEGETGGQMNTYVINQLLHNVNCEI